MTDLQSQLAARFSNLRDGRTGPVFFLEHGLTNEELAALVDGVRSSLQERGLSDPWWSAHDLPLLVAASEVGYRYLGAGTDFWPLLESDLGRAIGGVERHRIKELFSNAAARFRGARPQATPWAQAFHIIAWPIVHALLPLEFHRALASTLANLRESVADADDDSLYRAVRVAAPYPTARFATLLEDEELVVAVVRSVLDDAPHGLSQAVVSRLSEALRADAAARRGVAVARQLQRSLRVIRRGESRDLDVPRTRGTLRLRRTLAGWQVEAMFGGIEGEVAGRLRIALRRRRYAPRLWGVTARVPSDQILSGLPFALKLAAVPDRDSELFPGLEDLGLDPLDAATLHAFDLSIELPMLFAVSSDGEIARQVFGTSITGHRRYCVVMRPQSAALLGLTAAREIEGGLRCLDVDPRTAEGARTLGRLGYGVRFGVSVRFAGAPSVQVGGGTPTFLVGDVRVFAPLRVPDGGEVFFDVEGHTTTVGRSDLVRVPVREGAQRLKVANETTSRDYAYFGLSTIPPLEPAVRLALRSEDRTVQALLSGRLSLEVESAAPLDGLRVVATVTAGAREFSAAGPLGSTPQVVSAAHPVFHSILSDDEVRGALATAGTVTLHVRVGHLASMSLELSRVVRPCWWVLGDAPSLQSEGGAVDYGLVAMHTPTHPPAEIDAGSDAYLLAPIGLDPLEFGSSAPFATLCLAPPRTSLALPSLKKPRLARRVRGRGAGVGVEDLLEAYLRWVLAETRTVIGDLRRSQVAQEIDTWVAELCCGEKWAALETRLSRRDAWSLLEDACREHGLGRDEYLDLPEDEEAVVRPRVVALAVDRIRRAYPGLWARVRPPSDLTGDDYAGFDQAFADAYEALAAQYRASMGNVALADSLEEADPGDDPESWDAAFHAVSDVIELRDLAELLLPSDGAQRLMALDVASMSVDDVADELDGWAKASRAAFSGRPPSRDVLRAAYALWVEPEMALDMDWRGALSPLCSERTMARAVRFLALKARQARRGAV